MARSILGIDLDDVPITLSTDGLYHGKITVGKKPNGDLDRRHRSGHTEREVKQKFRTLLRALEDGGARQPGRVQTVQEWFEHWLSEIAPHGRKAIRPSTINNYRSRARIWIYPHLGRIRLDALEVDSLDAMYQAMRKAERSEGLIAQVHAVLRRGLAVAQQRGKISRNVAKMVDPPASPRPKRTPLPVNAAAAILREILGRRNAARWMVGLNIGNRQGEALGLCWPQVDLDAGTVDLCWQLGRLPWQHGCKNPHACGKTSGPRKTSRHRFTLCKPAARGARKGLCPQHTGPNGCPAPCDKDCTRHAAYCPDRHGGGLTLRRPKTWREDEDQARVVGLAPHVVEMLKEHRKEQRAEKRHAGAGVWRRTPHPEGGIADFVFRQPDGAPIDPHQDWEEWQSILEAAGLPPMRVHGMRHNTATVGVDLGIGIEVVQELLGHRQQSTTRGYQTVRTTVTAAAARKIGDHLFGASVTDLVTERRNRRAS